MKLSKAFKFAAIALALAATFTLPASVSALTNDQICTPDMAPEIKAAYGCSDASSNVPDAKDTAVTIISNIILALGIVAVVVIIVGGVEYMTSAGDPGKIKKAKETILYSVIGLVICALAFAIVNFVIGNVLGQ